MKCSLHPWCFLLDVICPCCLDCILRDVAGRPVHNVNMVQDIHMCRQIASVKHIGKKGTFLYCALLRLIGSVVCLWDIFLKIKFSQILSVYCNSYTSLELTQEQMRKLKLGLNF